MRYVPQRSLAIAGALLSLHSSYNAGVIFARLTVSFRRTVRIALLVLHLVWGVAVAGLAFPLFNPARRDRFIMAWAQRLLRVLGVRVRSTPPPDLAGGALLVCNHVSWLDIYLIYAARRVHFVSKAEVRDWPIAGWLARKTGTLFIERGRRADTARINVDMHDLMQRGVWVAVFPEGTTSDGRGLRRFMPSLLQPAVQLGCPIVPAALRYRTLEGEYTVAPAYIEHVNMWQSLLQIVSEPGFIAELQFGEPIMPDGHRRELAARAEQAVAGLLGISSAKGTASNAGSTGARGAASAGTESRIPAGPPA